MEKRSPEIITCIMCGVCFERQPRGRRPKCCTYCTTNRRRLEYEAQGHTCGDCGTVVERRVVNGPFPKFCGQCVGKRRSARSTSRYKPRPPKVYPPHPCLDCAAMIPGRQKQRCPACIRLRTNAKMRATYHERPEKRTRVCCDCGQRFKWWRETWTKRCQPCHAAWRADLRRSKNVARRMRQASVPYEFISRVQVFVECGWICGLCDLPVDAALRWPDRGSATLDHIVPISLGGGHVRSNVQLAHAFCNSRKGAQPLQLTEGLTPVSNKVLKMVSADGEHELEVDEGDAVEITQRRAEGWSLKGEKKANTQVEPK